MTTYARLVGSIVAEVTTADPTEAFHPDLAAEFVTVPDGTKSGWVKASNGSFAAPQPPPVTPASLLAYAANARFAVETGGINVAGMKVATDRQSQAMITAAYNATVLNPGFSTPWKAVDGYWSTLSSAQIVGVAQAVAAHVQACFAAEQACDAGINASPPTVTTTAQVDAAMAAIVL